jgi:hypothetical protein
MKYWFYDAVALALGATGAGLWQSQQHALLKRVAAAILFILAWGVWYGWG